MYRDHEHQAHPEGGGGADLGHAHDAIVEEGGKVLAAVTATTSTRADWAGTGHVEEEGPGLGGYRGEP